MSETETHVGTIKEIKVPDGDLESQVKYLEKKGFKFDDDTSEMIELGIVYCDDLELLKVKGKFRWFEYIKKREITESGVLTRNPDSSIDFVVSWYNGEDSIAITLQNLLEELEENE